MALTGYVGERINRAIALVTSDFRVYHELAPFFEAKGQTILGLRPGEPVPDAVQVLLDGARDDPRTVPLRADPEATWIAAMLALDGRRIETAIVGVDPGQTIGLALLMGGLVFWACQVQDAHAAAQRIAAWHTAHPAAAWRVHVGDGAPPVGRAVRHAVREAVPAATVWTVPERGSTPTSAATGSRHMDAAIHIAMRTP